MHTIAALCMATDQMIHVNAEKETHIDITSKYLNFSSRVYIVMLTSDAPVYEHDTSFQMASL